jgi:hypothetical protein
MLPLLTCILAETHYAQELATLLNEPQLILLCRRFLYDQLHAELQISPDDVTLQDCPPFDGKISRYNSGCAIFQAPSEDCSSNGMHRETVRSHPHWQNNGPRRDTVLIQNGDDSDPMDGMLVGRVLSFLSFAYNDVRYDTALVEWFLPYGDKPDAITGMWLVKPEKRDGRRHVGLVHVECIVRACHLIGVYGKHHLPKDFQYTFTLDTFNLFYVNHYIDYHAHECIS